MSFYKKAPLSVVNLVFDFNLNLADICEKFENAINDAFDNSECEFGQKYCDLEAVLAELKTETETVENLVIDHITEVTNILETTVDPRHKFQEFNYTMNCCVENNVLISHGGQQFTPSYFYHLHMSG